MCVVLKIYDVDGRLLDVVEAEASCIRVNVETSESFGIQGAGMCAVHVGV